MGRRYNKTLTIILAIIIVAILGLLGYLGYSYYSKYRISKDSSEGVDTFLEEVVVDEATVPGGNSNPTDNNTVTGDISTDPSQGGGDGSGSSSSTTKGKKRTYKGFNVLGTIEIPKTSVKYFVLEKVTKKSLETSVAVIYPFENPVLNAKRNVVIVGHNYRNGLFFSNNKRLSKGDKIYITDLDGKRVGYTIYKVFEADENDTSFYNRNTDGKREITLSTCTDDSKARLIIQARE